MFCLRAVSFSGLDVFLLMFKVIDDIRLAISSRKSGYRLKVSLAFRFIAADCSRTFSEFCNIFQLLNCLIVRG